MLIFCLFVSAAVFFPPLRPWTRMLSAGGDCRKRYRAQLAAGNISLVSSKVVLLVSTWLVHLKKKKKREGIS